MTKTYDEIKNEIEEVFTRNELTLAVAEIVYIPSEYYKVFVEETLGKGYSLTWWSIEVRETSGQYIYFIIKNREQEYNA